MPDFVNSEHCIEKLFPIGSRFSFEGKEYEVILSGKPRPSHGECKTDIYIKGVTSDGEVKEIKISIKQKNADFLENKMSLKRAYEILGKDASNIIKQCIVSIEGCFRDDYLICFERNGKTEAHTIKLGWKFELLNKCGGKKSGIIELTESQKYDVFAGINLSDDKKNSCIRNTVIANSGVADYLLEVTSGENISKEDCLEMMQPIGEYANSQNIYFACKALNYRYDKDKWDGPRPLSVYVNWFIDNEKLNGQLVFDSPLEHEGHEIGNNLKLLLKKLQIKEFNDLKGKLSPDVKCYPKE